MATFQPLPNIKAQTVKGPTTWHGANGRFSSHYVSRFYQDNSMKKAAQTAFQKDSYLNKAEFYNKEIEKIEQNRFMLLNISREKEKFEKIKKKVMSEKRRLEKRMKSAVVVIQKHIRGYLCRRHHQEELADLKKVKLIISMKFMKKYVGECCIYLADNIVEATITIQKYMRRYLAKKLLKFLKIQDKAARVITRFFRAIKNRAKFRKSVQRLVLKKKLKEIKNRLKWLKFQSWWKIHRKCFQVIRRKNRSRNSSVHTKTPGHSRKGSMDVVHRSRKTSALIFDRSLHEKIANLQAEYNSGPLLNAPGEKFDSAFPIEEVLIEDSLSLTLQAPLHHPDNNQSVEDSNQIDLNNKGENISESNEDSRSMKESFSHSSEGTSQNKPADDEEEGVTVEDPQEFSEAADDPLLISTKDDKNKKIVEEETEKPIPSYRKPTAAFNSWKKRPPTPEKPPKEIFPPPRHLLVWTKCRKIYKNQTKKYRKKIPLWKPPLTANNIEPRKLPKIVKKTYRIPDFLEPYVFAMPSETPENMILLNQDEDKDNYDVDSDTSYEYEAADYRSTGLSTALPQLNSIVRSYGKNADMIGKIKQTS